MMSPSQNNLLLFFISFLIILPLTSSFTSCTCSQTPPTTTSSLLPLKLAAIASILLSGFLGILLPLLGRRLSLFSPLSDPFLAIKAFAAGVILATAFIHILPNAFDRLTSPCLPFHRFPLAGFVAMAAAVATMTVDSLATGFVKRSVIAKALPVNDDGVVVVEAGREVAEETAAQRVRHRVVSQVLELGIVVHSVIIGISLGTSKRSSTIRPLLGALSFHQFFEGVGLGGCIVQADFKVRAMVIMTIFFSLTAPTGVGIGIAISSGYQSDSSTALALEGVFDAAASGILIYMALVDLLAADFMSERMQTNLKLQLVSHLALLLGAGLMSILAIWA